MVQSGCHIASSGFSV